MEAFARDVRLTLRSLIRDPAFTLVAVTTLALGIGATAAIFSVVDGVVLDPLPYAAPEQLVVVRTVTTDGRPTTGRVSPYSVTRIHTEADQLVGLAGFRSQDVAIVDREERPLSTAAFDVTEGFFDILSLPMAEGRGFLPEEHAFPAHTVVLSHGLWQNSFGGDPGVVGSSIATVDGSLTVVGVARPEFDYPAGADLWLASRRNPNEPGIILNSVARLAPGASVEQAQSELDRFADRFRNESSAFQGRAFSVEPLHAALVGDTARTLLVLLGAAAMLLLIACANVMSLTLARGATRESSVALRSALGAGRKRIIGQLMTESVVIALAGAAAGLGLAAGLLGASPSPGTRGDPPPRGGHDGLVGTGVRRWDQRGFGPARRLPTRPPAFEARRLSTGQRRGPERDRRPAGAADLRPARGGTNGTGGGAGHRCVPTGPQLRPAGGDRRRL